MKYHLKCHLIYGISFFNMRVAKQISDVKTSWAIVEK
jgi:hypothetical protein